MEKQRLVIAELGWARIYCPTALTTDVEICEIIYIYIKPFQNFGPKSAQAQLHNFYT